MSAAESDSLSCIENLFKTPAQFKKLFFVIVVLLLFYTCTGSYVTDTHFDYFVFSQRWLPTACIEYMEHHSSSNDQHNCIKLKHFMSWAIHGLWPTQNSHIGPFFCNKNLPFNINKIKSIVSELKVNWPNIEERKGEASLWQHEWEKHGTCAAQLELLNSELKYFTTTLKLFELNNMQSILADNGITPKSDKGVNITQLFYVIKNRVGKLPQIHCIHEVKTKLPYLSEIRLCYSKSLEPIDCGNIKNSELNSKMDLKNTLTNCPLNSEVIYPQSIISNGDKLSLENSPRIDYYDSLQNILNIIRFLQWASI